MRDPRDPEQRLREREVALGIAGAATTISPQVRISERTLLVAAPASPRTPGRTPRNLTPASDEALAPTVSDSDARAPAPTSTAPLPRITIDLGGEATSTKTPDHGGSPEADFAVVGVLGEGGMGRVHLALQRSLGRHVAIKTLKDHAEPVDQEALLREGRLTGSLEHPGIVPVHALGLDERGKPLLVMKRVEGVSLRTLLDDPDHPGWDAGIEGGADRLEAIIAIMSRVCEALAFAHSRGVVHRDIKPDNVMVGSYGEVHLLDWGIGATVEEAAASGAPLVGTPVYMAPEIVLGDPVDARTDVYLLGSTLHEILTGRFRHEGATLRDVLRSVAFSVPAVFPPDVPADLADLCNRATARDPARRPPDADAFRRELVRHLRRRSAMALCNAAIERTGELESLLPTGEAEIAPEALAAAYRLATEARFGYAQSLREEPSFGPARRGLERCLLALVDVELRQGHAHSAAALLGEIEAPQAEWLARVDEARARAERVKAAEKQLAEIARDLDASTSARARIVGLVALAAAVVAVTASTWIVPGPDALTNSRIVQAAFVMAGAFFATIFVLRRRFFANLLNRRLSASVMVGFGVIVLHRVFGLWEHQRAASVLGDDMLLLATVVATTAVTVERSFWISAIPLLVMRVPIAMFPEHASPILAAATLVAVASAIWVMHRRASEKRARDE